ncbi:MAG: MarR family transcriptional regulator [Halobacteriota archaeon]
MHRSCAFCRKRRGASRLLQQMPRSRNIFILLTPLIYLVKTMNSVIAEAISNNEPFTERLREYPPSVKLVFKTLENNGTMTLNDIEKETYLPYRTVRYAVKRLKEGGFVARIFHIEDARQSLYRLAK